MPPKHVTATLREARTFWNWAGITDFVELSEQISQKLTAGIVPELPENVAQILSGADEIHLHTIWRPFEKFILGFAPQARLVLFDNGLDSHLERAVVIDDNSFAQGCIRQSDLRRISSFMYTLGDLIPLPSFADKTLVSVPCADDLYKHYHFMAEKVAAVSRTDRNREPAALLLGTSLYRHGKFSVLDEADVYSRFRDDVRDLGYGAVWKSHPRAGSDLIGKNFTHVCEPFDQSLPIEFLPLVCNIAVSGSISSTALLTLKKVFGIPYLVLGKPLASRLDLPWLKVLYQYAETEIPALTEAGR